MLWEGIQTNEGKIALIDNIKNYNYYEIIYDASEGNTLSFSTGKIPTNKGCRLFCINDKALMFNRNINAPSESTITVKQGKYYSSLNSNGTVYGNACRPIRILGYK